VQVLPTGPAAAVADLLTEHARAERPEAPQALDVDVQELAGPLALVAAHRLARGQAQARDAVTAEHLDGRSASADQPPSWKRRQSR
jgi:hypothetical protein